MRDLKNSEIEAVSGGAMRPVPVEKSSPLERLVFQIVATLAALHFGIKLPAPDPRPRA